MSDITYQFGFVTYQKDGEAVTEPSLGIKRIKIGDAPIYAIPLSRAYKFADTKYLIAASFKIADFLGMFPDRFLINRIADLILNYLPDLITQKPFVEQDSGKECGELDVRINGDIVAQVAVTDKGGIIH